MVVVISGWGKLVINADHPPGYIAPSDVSGTPIQTEDVGDPWRIVVSAKR
jgi:hypothetical protein